MSGCFDSSNIKEKFNKPEDFLSSLHYVMTLEDRIEKLELFTKIIAGRFYDLSDEVKSKTTDLSFEEALKFLKEGKKLRRKSWENKDFFLQAETMTIFGCAVHELIENDWEIIDEK